MILSLLDKATRRPSISLKSGSVFLTQKAQGLLLFLIFFFTGCAISLLNTF